METTIALKFYAYLVILVLILQSCCTEKMKYDHPILQSFLGCYNFFIKQKMIQLQLVFLKLVKDETKCDQ